MTSMVKVGQLLLCTAVLCAAAFSAQTLQAAVGTLADSSGEVVAWGDNFRGQTSVPSGTFIAIAAGAEHSLGIRSDGTLAGWGYNSDGQIIVPSGTFTAIAAGYYHNLSIASTSQVLGWGYDYFGQVTNTPSSTFTAVAAGAEHSLGILGNGKLAGWGNNLDSQTSVPSGTFTAIAAGGYHSLGIRSDGTLAGWGLNSDGQTVVPSGTFDAISAGASHSIGIRSDGTLAGWGLDSEGQTNVPSGAFTAIAAGGAHSLGIRSDGTLTGWGSNVYGQVDVPSGTFTAIAAGYQHSLALRARTDYDGDLLIFGTGMTANLNRSVTVAGDAKVGTITQFYDTPTATLNGKLILTSGAAFSGNGTIIANGVELQTDFTVPANLSLASTGPLSGTGDLGLSSGVNLNVGLAPASLYSGDLLVANNASLTFTGTGFQTAGALMVDPSGETRLGPGQSLRSTGVSEIRGKLELLGSSALGSSEIEFRDLVTVDALTGLITGRNAVMRFTGDLYNYGSVLLNAGVNDIFGDVNNAEDANIMVAGGASATFYDDVYQDGTLQVLKVGSTTSTAIFAGAFAGIGGSGGGGDIFFLGDLRPGNSPAVVSYDNNVAFGPAASLQVELGGIVAGNQYDQVQISGELSLGGTLDVSLLSGFTPTIGDSFDILDWGTLTGTFAGINLPTLSGLEWDTSQLYTDGLLAVVSAGLPGDYNGNGTIDAADYSVWRDALTAGSTSLTNDPTPGTVDESDFLYWREHFGETAGIGASSTASVPEPHTVLLLCVGAVVVATIRVRRSLGISPM